jgi:hypothetical protein
MDSNDVAGQTTGSGTPDRATIFNPDRVRIGVDTLVIRFQGIPEGSHVLEMRNDPDGFIFSESIKLLPYASRDVRIWLTPSLEVRKVELSGLELGHETSADLTYGANHVAGRIRRVRNGQLVEAALDQQLPAGAFDGTALLGLLPTVDWRMRRDYRLVIFDTDEGSTTEQVLRVVRKETVKVPAGKFKAFRGELTTTQLPVKIWVTQSEPRRILKMSSAKGLTVLVR